MIILSKLSSGRYKIYNIVVKEKKLIINSYAKY